MTKLLHWLINSSIGQPFLLIIFILFCLHVYLMVSWFLKMATENSFRVAIVATHRYCVILNPDIDLSSYLSVLQIIILTTTTTGTQTVHYIKH